MKLLLTGGTGYIGSHTAVALAQAGHEVVLLDNLSNSSARVVDLIARIIKKEVFFVQGDVLDYELIKDVLSSHHIDAVFHFAGFKAVGESVSKPLDYYENNIAGTLSLLKAMQALSIKKLVFSSSATVYGNPTYLPLDEDHPTSATNPYARTKLHLEQILADLAISDSEWQIACLRYFNPVGAHESQFLSEAPAGVPNNLMPYVTQVAEGKYLAVRVFGNDYATPDGTGVRDYIHVMDLAEGHLAALDFLNQIDKANVHQSDAQFHVFNLGTGRGYSVLEVLKAFESANHIKVAHEFVARRPGDVAECYADSSKAAKLLKWTAKRNLEDMCQTAWAAVRRLAIS